MRHFVYDSLFPATFVLARRAHEQVAMAKDMELKNLYFLSLKLTWCGGFYFPQDGYNKISDPTCSSYNDFDTFPIK